jgi:hypothetical protein
MSDSQSIAPLLAAFCVLLLAVAFAVSSMVGEANILDAGPSDSYLSSDLFQSPEPDTSGLSKPLQ